MRIAGTLVLILILSGTVTDSHFILQTPSRVAWLEGKQENQSPQVSILSPDSNQTITWNSQVRYEISVSDAEDGESVYGELNPNEVLMEVFYLYETDKHFYGESESLQKRKNGLEGLDLIRTSGCFGCHRDKNSMTGPSFSEIAQRHEKSVDAVITLGKRIREGSSGNWGDIVMPPHRKLSKTETKKMAAYILKEGGNEYTQVYPGLKGLIRIIEKPAGESPDSILLKASYLDHGIDGDPDSRKKGIDILLLRFEDI